MSRKSSKSGASARKKAVSHREVETGRSNQSGEGRASVTRWLAPLFLVSGATALVYEIIWVRYLGLAFGSTTYSITTVLAAFMGGLALGSLWIGKLADRPGQRPLRVYAILEAGIGLFGLLSPLIFHFFLTWGSRLLPEAALLDASSGLANSPQGVIDGLCSPCHDPHGVSPSLGDDTAYAVPLLKGTWLT